MDMMDRLAKERRARLAAERLLEHKSRELVAANEKLALHARALSEQVMAQRAATVSALSQAEMLKDQNTRFLSDLDRAHTAAVMAERRLWDSIDTIRDGFAVFDAGRRLVAANSAWVTLFGAEAHAPGTEWPVILADALARDLFHLDETRTAFVDRMLARWEDDVIAPETLCRTNGVWLRLTERRARDGDIVALVIDITEEMRLWAAIDALPDGMAIFDNEERLVICNQRFRDLQGLPSDVAYPGAGLEAILRAGLDPLDPDGDDWVARRLAQHRAPQGAVEGCLDDGRWLRSETHVTPDGGRVAICRDISDARAAEAAVLAARDQAEAASRAKSAFLANMSHEIRTPMNGVVGMAELLCDTPLTEDQRLFADTIRSSGEALLAIINDILDYSKLEAARLTIHAEPFDLERLIHEVAMLLQPRAQEKRLNLMIDYDMFLPTRFVGDAGRLRQVLTNLVGNAVKFTDRGHVLIRVVGFPADEGRQQLHVTVEDTGIGIATDHLDHIFGEFNQVEDAANRRFEGTGLGLAITRRIVERMAGAV
ncbi:MAG: PAS domain-containing protein, partial [Rhodobacteraceae bacterium]|nr:PAS domain-containing protein [Paracoccaceae bacterium]